MTVIPFPSRRLDRLVAEIRSAGPDHAIETMTRMLSEGRISQSEARVIDRDWSKFSR